MKIPNPTASSTAAAIRPSGRFLLPLILTGLLSGPLVIAAPVTLMSDSYVGVNGLALRGRVIEQQTFSPEAADDSSRVNMQRTLGRLRQAERRAAPVRVQFGQADVTLKTDREGRFDLTVAPGPVSPGWYPLTTQPAAAADARVFVPHPDNRFVLVSDVDDTVLWSEVNDKRRLLQHSLMENSLQRRGFAGTAAFYRSLAALDRHPAQASWFYLSASPQQLGPPIRAFMQREGLPDGVLLLKMFAWRGGDPWLDQKRYKTAVLETLLRDFPGRQFILIGDDGEHDPEIYRDLASRYPERIALTLIRRVNPDTRRVRYDSQCDLDAAQRDSKTCPALQALHAQTPM